MGPEREEEEVFLIGVEFDMLWCLWWFGGERGREGRSGLGGEEEEVTRRLAAFLRMKTRGFGDGRIRCRD